jgi:tRNA-specific 2-thiouridylase
MEWKTYNAKIRYRQWDQLCEIKKIDHLFKIVFEKPQRAVASGQICVIYEGDRVVGSGVIV